MKNKQRESVNTERPLLEVWSRLGYFESVYSCEKFLRERIQSGFHGLDYNSLNQAKISSNLELDLFEVITEQDVKKKAIELSYCIGQAREYYGAARNTTELTRPVLLHYGMISLAKALIVSTYTFRNPKKGHGLAADDSYKYVIVQDRGLFPRFHDCYLTDPKLYTLRPRLGFNLKELFSVIPELRHEYESVYNESSRINPHIDSENEMDNRFSITKNGNTIVIPSLSSHFLSMFLLSSIARYRSREWGRLLEGKESSEVYIVRKFLEVSARRFPNLILNELFGKTFLFYTPARM